MRKLLLYLVPLILFTNISYALIEIDITEGNREPLPLAISEFFHDNNPEIIDKKITENIRTVISDDLERSGLFSSIDNKAFIQNNRAMHLKPRFADWRLIKAQGLLTGELAIEEDRLRVEFRLWDTFAEKEIEGLVLITTIDNWRRISHMIADKIYERLTGEEGYFDTRIVYVAEEGPKNKRIKKLAIMDQDGANHKFLTDGSYLALTPRFSPAAQEVAYLSYNNTIPRIFLLDLETGNQKILGDFPGMTFSPRYSPDGKKLVMSLARDGNTDIYEMNLSNQKMKRLTFYDGIDTAPSYSPDGDFITFESDRSGSQKIYIMNLKTKKIKRISFGKGKYATPVWSPRGDLIAFTKLLGGEFYIGVMYTDGKGERVVYKSYLVEGPTWSPNGRVIAFYNQNKLSGGRITDPKIKMIDLTGINLRELVTPSDGSDPAWSGLLP